MLFWCQWAKLEKWELKCLVDLERKTADIDEGLIEVSSLEMMESETDERYLYSSNRDVSTFLRVCLVDTYKNQC